MLNIGASIHYTPLHLMPLYRLNVESEKISLPVTEYLSGNILTLPISASMSKRDATYVITNFIEVIKNEK